MVTIARRAQSRQSNKLSIFLQYLKKDGRDEVDFWMQLNIKLTYELVLPILVSMVSLAQISNNKKQKWKASSNNVLIIKLKYPFRQLHNQI